MGTGLGVSQGVMMVLQVIPAGSGDCLELMIGQAAAEMPS